MLKRFVRNIILSRFYKIALSSKERELADGAVDGKYAPAISQASIFSLLLIPSLLLLNTEIVVSILIPTTMVAGTAWFAISLSTMKEKFEDFGTELTTDLFVAFALSLMMLFLAALASLTMEFWEPAIEATGKPGWAKLTAAALAMVVIGKLVLSIFKGSLKYDINDAMLAGQNEAAEKFFRNSLSLLHSTSELLKSGKDLSVANYSIGLAFFEIFSSIQQRGITTMSNLDQLIEKANDLIMDAMFNNEIKGEEREKLEKEKRLEETIKEKADGTAYKLVNSFFIGCRKSQSIVEHKSFKALEAELFCLKHNEGESQFMTDTRFSVIFEEMSELIEQFGHTLFEKENAQK